MKLFPGIFLTNRLKAVLTAALNEMREVIREDRI